MKRINHLALAGLVAAALVVVGCGSSSDDSSSSSSAPSSTAAADSSSGSSSTDAIAAEIDKLKVRPTSIGLDTPIGKAIPTGKRIVFISSCQETCTKLYDNTKEAGAVLGWKVDFADASKGTPEVTKNVWETILANPPDGIIQTGGFPHEWYAAELKQAQAKGIPVVTQGDSQPSGDGIISSVEINRYANNGVRMADFMIADTKGKANVVIQNLPGQQGIVTMSNAMKDELQSKCSGCKVKVWDMAVTNPNPAGATASQVQATPGTNYVTTAFGDFTIGLPAALAGAGVGSTSILTQVQDAPVIQYMKKGQNVKGVYGYPGPEITWRVIDAFARHFAGVDVKVDESAPYPEWFITPDHLTPDLDSGYFPLVEDYQAQYKKLWNK